MTLKQTKALNKVVENGGNISKAMRDSGYSSSTAKNPKKLTNSKAWNELLDYYLPDEMLIAVLAEDIKSRPENRKTLLELAFKLKGKFDVKTHNVLLPQPILSGLNMSYKEIMEQQKIEYFGGINAEGK